MLMLWITHGQPPSRCTACRYSDMKSGGGGYTSKSRGECPTICSEGRWQSDKGYQLFVGNSRLDLESTVDQLTACDGVIFAVLAKFLRGRRVAGECHPGRCSQQHSHGIVGDLLCVGISSIPADQAGVGRPVGPIHACSFYSFCPRPRWQGCSCTLGLLSH